MLERPTDEVPPPQIWHHAERLEEWFAAVEQTKKDRAGGLEKVPEADENTMVNELATGIRS